MNILITGANRGLGERVVERLADSTNTLFLTARDLSQLSNAGQRIKLDLAESNFEQLWPPFESLALLDAVIHIASPYINNDLTMASADQLEVVAQCAINEFKFLSRIARKINPDQGVLVVTGAILAIPGYRGKGLMSWYKSSLHATAEILHHELKPNIKVYNFNLGTIREDQTMIDSGDAIDTTWVAEQIVQTVTGKLVPENHEVLLMAPNNDKTLTDMIS